MPAAAPINKHSASHSRRERLRQTECSTIPTLSNLFPIDRYYSAAYKVLEAHDAAMARKHLDDAYVYGKRFGNFASKALPTHDYYTSPQLKYKRMRLKCEQDLGRVIDQLETVAQWMDVEEEARRKREEEERKRLWKMEQERRKVEAERRKREEEEQRKRRAILDQAERRRRAEEAGESFNEEDGDGGGPASGGVALTDKLDLLNELFPQTPSGVGENQKNSHLPPAEDMSKLFVREENAGLPPPLPVPLPVPTTGQSKYNEGDSALYFQSGSETPTSVKIVKVHHDDGVVPYFTILLPDGREKQTDVAHLAPLAAAPPPPPPPSYSQVTGDKPGASAPSAPPPPSYNSIVPNGTANGGGVIAAPAGGMLPPDSAMVPHAPTEWNRRSAREELAAKKVDQVIPFGKLRHRLLSQYQDLQNRNLVELHLLNTFQGRLASTGKDSTNGCAVISPLVAAQHLRNASSAILPDRAIERVIDDEAPPILRAVRSKLGLGHAALIIPSDVHDYLVDRKILRQDKFVGVCGGNILDSEHIGSLVDMLYHGTDGDESGKTKDGGEREGSDTRTKKHAATLFFHEHVISILKIAHPSKPGTTWFDIVDSLPHPQSRANGSPRASRTRCKDRDSLEITLKYYACSKFSDVDRQYIDNNLWDEVMCDFDPRVFQGFVWAAE